MIRREMKLVITFALTTQALAMEAACKEAGAPGRLIPVPTAITAGCGLAWCAALEDEAALREMMARRGIAPQAVQICMV